MSENKNYTDVAIGGIQEIARFLWSVAALLAPWLVPLAPAIFFGWAIYQTGIANQMVEGLAKAAAIAAAIGLETVNIAANHAMLKLSHDYREHGGKFTLSIVFIFVYVTIGVVAMGFLDAPLSVKVLGVGMFLLSPVAIGAQALTMDLMRVKQETDQRDREQEDDRVWKRKQAQRQQEFDHERRLELARLRWQHKTDVAIAGKLPTIEHQPVPTGGNLPAWLPVIPADLAEFRRLVDDGTITLTAEATGSALAEYIPAVGSDSTGRYWLRQARNGKPQ